MAQDIANEQKVRVVTTKGIQTVQIPDEFRFLRDEIFARRDLVTGALLLSEKPLQQLERNASGWTKFFNEIDAIGDEDFKIERDESLPRDIDL